MYRAKSRQHAVECHDPSTTTTTAASLALLADLRTALGGGAWSSTTCPGQPHDRSGPTRSRPCVRWWHPDRGTAGTGPVRPPLAEGTGPIRPSRPTCWPRPAPDRPVAHRGVDLTVSVNLSARNLHDPTCHPAERDASPATTCPPATSSAEATESSIMDDPGAGGHGPEAPRRARGAPGHRRLRHRATRRSPTCSACRSTRSRSTARSWRAAADRPADQVIVRSTIDLARNSA